ncbi:MAG TPA: right-handed parallel beta-helix repeat-containing protein, partial [Candidatus Nanoarchaeia archaeon]|nr:right-handed parallel beta-helix repeat-containing protein [Candidatus Nanoarchaeia archaeon]
MGRTLLASRVAELHRKLHEAEKNRQIVLSRINSIKEACVNKEITYSEYEKKLATLVSGKTLPQWIEYYDSYIALCKLHIENLHKQHKKNTYKNYFLFAFSIIFLLLFFKLNITGFIVSNQESNSSVYTESLDYFFSNNSQNVWSQSNPGQIISVSFSGEVYGEGNAKIFFDDYLISDLSLRQEKISSAIGLTGFAVSDSESSSLSQETSESTQQTSQSTESESPSHTSSQTQDNIPQEINSSNSQEQPEQGSTIENPSHTPQAAQTNNSVSQTEIEEEQNATQNLENQTQQTKKFSFQFNCNNECVLSQYSINQIEHIIRVELNNVNISIDSIRYEIIPVVPENVTIINETLTLESPIVIEQPVQWKKEITIDQPGEINVEVPEQAKSISVSSLEDSSEKVVVDSVDPSKEKDKKDKNKEIILDAKSNSYEVLYETPAPVVKESILSETEKEVTISAPDELNYTNVFSFTTLPSPMPAEQANKIKLYWEVNGTQVEHPFTVNDTDGDGLIDSLQWITPHLSEQKFIIIIITKAEHLDSNKEFISDIYESVKELDGNWSQIINDSEYVRVIFESKLNNKNDITIYPKVISGNPIVEVYEFNSTSLIATFENITSQAYNKVFLTSLQGEQDTFDLKVVGGSVQFDHIIDPTPKVLPSGTRNGMFVVSNSTSQIPNYFMWNGSNWSARQEALAVGGIPEWLTVRSGIVRDEYIIVSADNVDDINIQMNFTNSSGQRCWGNGTACNVVWEVNATSTTANVQKVDLAYSHLSGNALVVWSDNSRRPFFTVWNGSYWSRPLTVNDSSVSNIGSLALTGANIETVQLAARSNNSDEIALLLTDSNDDSQVIIWNGTGFDCESPVLSISLGTTDVQKADLDYEDMSGDLFIASIASTTRINITTKAVNTCTFSTTSRTVNDAEWIDVAAQPGTDNVMLAGALGGATDDIEAQVWRGSAWGNVSAEDTADYANAASPNQFFSAAWAGLKAGIMVYSDAANNAVDWFHFNTTSMAWQGAPATDFTPTPAFSTTGESNIKAYSFIDENKTMAFFKDANLTHSKVWAKIYNAETNTWSNTESPAQPLIWNATNSLTYFPTFDFTWQRYITPPSRTISYPANTTYNVNVSMINYTRSGASYCWYSTNNGATNSSPSGTCSNFTNVISTQGSNTWIVYTNDSLGVWDSSNVTFFLDSIAPTIDYGLRTETNSGVVSRSNIIVNVTSLDTNLANITIRLYNSTNSLLNETNSSTSPFILNFTGLVNGIYKFNASAYDRLGNVNNTSTYTVTVNSTDIYGCTTLNINGGVYVQKANIIPADNGNCLNITASNIILDGNGYWIKNSTYAKTLILAKGVNNITIKNTNITLSQDVQAIPINLTNTNNSAIYNNTISSAGPIFLISSHNNSIENNTISQTTSGIQNYNGHNNQFRKNTIFRTSISSGIYVENSNNTLIEKNQINDTSYANYYDGIYLYNQIRINDSIIKDNILFNSSIAVWGDGQNSTSLSILNNSVFNSEVTGNGAITLYGEIDSASVKNNTINNSADQGITISSTYQTLVDNNFVSYSATTGISPTGTNKNNITNNILYNNYNQGIYISGSSFFVYNNTIVGIGINSGGMHASSSDNLSIVKQNNISNINNYGMTVDSGLNKIEIINNSFSNIKSSGILVYPTSYNVYILNNTFRNLTDLFSQAITGGKYIIGNYIFNSTNGIRENSDSGENGTIANNTLVYIKEAVLSIGSLNKTIFNNTIINASNSAIYLQTYSAESFNNTKIINQYIENYTLASGNMFSVENTQFGKIEFIEIIGNTTGTNFSRDLFISNNSISINNTLSGLNKSANITFYGIKNDWVNPAILKDGVECVGCYNFTSLNSGTVRFNVSSWSENFSIGEKPNSTVYSTQLIVYTFPSSNSGSPTTIASGVSGSTIVNDQGLTTWELPASYAYPTDPELRFGPKTGATNAATAVSTNSYISFTITPDSDIAMNLTSITFAAARGGASTPRGWVLRSSVDSYSADIASSDLSTTRPTWSYFNIPLSAASFTNLTSATTFRLYVYSPSTSSTIEIDDLNINGTLENREGNPIKIISVFPIADQSITENSKTNVLINFTVRNLDGYTSINSSTAKINLTRTGESTVRQNTTCIRYQQGGTLANFSCILDIWYFDSAGEWNISAFISDNSSRAAINTSTNLTILQTSAFVLGPSSISIGTLEPGATNKTAVNNPIIINNTGNKPITAGNIQINATDLVGETDNSKAIYANNFSVGTQTGASAECGGTGSTLMSKSVFSALSGATLPKGNHSILDGTGQEQIYVCIKNIGTELTAQSYSTSGQGSWTIKILVVAFSLRRRNKLKKDRLFKVVSLLKQEKEIALEIKEKAIKEFTLELATRHNLSEKDIENSLQTKQEISIPLSVFSTQLGALEAISLYLREKKLLKFSEIAEILQRNERTIWT